MDHGQRWAGSVRAEVSKAVLGQDEVVERLLVAMLADGHVLLEGMPGLAKPLLVRSIGTAMGLQCERVQFTPDLLPSDVVGTMVFQPQSGEFTTHLGPIFANLVLADVNDTGDEEFAKLARSATTIPWFSTSTCPSKGLLRYASRSTDTFGRLDIMLNNARIDGAIGPLEDLTVEPWKRSNSPAIASG